MAVNLAYTHPKEISGVILENTFTSLPDMFGSLIPGAHVLPNFVRDGLLWHKMRNEEKLSSDVFRDIPMLFISGAKDDLVPPAQMEALCDSCTSTNKTVLSVEAGGHMDSWKKAGSKFYEVVSNFMGSEVNFCL